MSQASTTKPRQSKAKRYMLVRHGRMKTLGLFEHREANVPKTETRVVIKTDKGLELGTLVGQLTAYRDGRLRFSNEQLKQYFHNSEISFPFEADGRFVRFASPDDVAEEQHLNKITEEEIASCRRFAEELNLPMKVVDAEHIFGGERIVFYFMADGRVDFRELVRKLAHEYQTRIEMRQIGARDEAKLLGDVETCGQVCCCIRFLQLLKPVNMRMAKMQKATLDPAKISGYCGRLKCCLRYEDQTYTQLKQKLPRRNSLVKTKQGQGRVVDSQILTQLVVVEYEGGERAAVNVDEIEVIGTASPKKRSAQNGPPDTPRRNRDNRQPSSKRKKDAP